ncbi:MAG: heme-binding protein [Alphaproteobacteria bacterium]|nr:heme-binding protein [Alphaproteobacteria bacterium]
MATAVLAAALAFALALPASAQLADRKALTLEAAKKIMAAAEAEAMKNKWTVAIAIVDEAGELLMMAKLDGTQPASIDIAIGKARTAARLKRETKLLEEAVTKTGRTVILALPGVTPLEGGVPIKVGDQVVGAVGVSGVTSAQDAQVAMAGIAVIK